MLKPLPRSTLTSQATEAIKRFILQENLRPGDRLPSESELCEALAISRTIVREALSGLAVEGLIVKQTGRGSFIQEFDHERLAACLSASSERGAAPSHALDDFRVALEIGALELVVQHVTDDELEGMTRTLERYERKQRAGKGAPSEDREFHLALLRATKNEYYVDTIPLVTAGFRGRMVERPSSIRRFVPGRNVEAHWAILEALKARDVVAAQAALRSHFASAGHPRTIQEEEP
jgi:GntR family transcriptional regulator, transcriptional repressor for pyruvate dehydrogenase complex